MNAVKTGSNPAPTTPTVLLAEDDFLVRLVVAESIRDAGFRVIEAVSGDEALSVLKSGTCVDAVVTDFNMPGAIDGVRLAKLVREYRPRAKIVLMSGALTRAPEGCDVDRFLTKPFLPSDIVDLLRSLLQETGRPD